jgi:hypothetical protein
MHAGYQETFGLACRNDVRDGCQTNPLPKGHFNPPRSFTADTRREITGNGVSMVQRV